MGAAGSCAIVGNSDNMIGGGRGKEIDDHDTILRHNTPMRGFEKDVGSRRSIVYMKVCVCVCVCTVTVRSEKKSRSRETALSKTDVIILRLLQPHNASSAP